MEPGQKKSSAVSLAIMGTAMAGAVGIPMLFGGTDVQRNRYTSRETCIADYSEAQCNPDVPNGTVVAPMGGPSTYYYGPWYRSDYRSRTSDSTDPGPGRYYRGGGTVSGFSSAGGASSAPAGVESGTRGGFGRSGHVSARGG
jgi:hypothetical protein